MKRATVILFLTVALAGCLQGEPDDTVNAGPDGARDPNLPHFIDISASNCDGATVAVMIEPQYAYKSLPIGFIPRDAKGLFDSEVSTGKVPVFVAALDCQEAENDLTPSEYGLGVVGVFIEPPEVEGVRNSVVYDFYLTMAYPNSTAFQSELTALGWPNIPASVVVQLPRVSEKDFENISTPAVSVPEGVAPEGYATEAIIIDADSEVFSMRAVTPAPLPEGAPGSNKDWSLRFWHQTSQGIGFIEYNFILDVPIGSAYCEMTNGTAPAETTGHTFCSYGDYSGVEFPEVPEELCNEIPVKCPQFQQDDGAPGDSTIAAVFPNMDVNATLAWFPNGQAL